MDKAIATGRSLAEIQAGVPQRVTEGYTQSGLRGLFTSGMLVLRLREGEDAEQVARRNGWTFIK